MTRLELIERFLPMTEQIGLFCAPADAVGDALALIATKLHAFDGRYPRLQQGWESGTRASALRRLLPLNGGARRYSVLECGQGWSAAFGNGWRGIDPTSMATRVAKLKCKAAIVTMGPHGDTAREMQESFRKGLFDGIGVEVLDWVNGVGTRTVRHVALVYEAGLEFFDIGAPLAGEDTSAYRSRRLRDRVRLAQVAALCRLLGVALLDPAWNCSTETVGYYHVDFGDPVGRGNQDGPADVQPEIGRPGSDSSSDA